MSAMNNVYFFGVIGRSGHEMWRDESNEMLPLPSVEYAARQRSKRGGNRIQKNKIQTVTDHESVSCWLVESGNCVTLPWAMVDSVLCPGARKRIADSQFCDVRAREQVEGQFALHHRDGWTAMAWWDRSGRDGFWSNAALFAHGTFTADEMLEMGRAQFPAVMARMTYDFVPGVFSTVTKANTSVVLGGQDLTVPKRGTARTRDALEIPPPATPPVVVVFLPPDLSRNPQS